MITLGELSLLAQTLLATQRDSAALELALKTSNECARLLREESIPSAMHELGITNMTLDTGEKISIKQDVYASIPVEQKEVAYGWLEQHGFGGLIKTEVVCHFTRGELERANELVFDLRCKGLQPELGRTVHPQTLKAFLREQLESASVDIPLDLFGARPVWTTKISTK